MELKFRFATQSDVKSLVDLCNLCFEEETDYQQAAKVFNETYGDPNQLYLVGFLDEEMVAHTKITIVPTCFTDMDTYAILNHVCVSPEYRRHHIGKYMMDVVKKTCKERGCTSIKLWSKNFRKPAHALYLHEGFEVVDAKFFECQLEEE